MPRLFVFGLGYSALAIAGHVMRDGWTVIGTTRSPESAKRLKALGIEPVLFDGSAPLDPASLAGTTHLLASIPADPDDPALRHHAKNIAATQSLEWIGYLSTTSVYGVTDGSTVDEDFPCAPSSARGQRRLAAERAWQGLPLPGHIFRLSGIYGPGRSVFGTIRTGKAQRVIKPGQAFNRIHVEDIATTVHASMAKPAPGRIYNLADDLPVPSADLVTYACELMSVEPPPEIPFDEAVLSPMAREFWADNKRIDNSRIKAELGVKLAYPTYREGLSAILAGK
ncbi:MAG TPA: SDR family oxidoreductase [Alphaproteobacteria bacterium]|jgi:nucleoside-diphosphate-sugar epimerase|nr:SDR family oxidoreductase [Alphaproteobacteria bacterium]